MTKISRAQFIKNIVLHCTAGFGKVHGIERFWREDLGWMGKGYSFIIDLDGTIWWLKDPTAVNGYTINIEEANLEAITNGVKGQNSKIISGSYIGGIDKVDGEYIAKDTRTDAQKASFHIAIQHVIKWLKENGKDITKDLGIVGHRDFSTDKNKNGFIDSWERIKECPSWDVLTDNLHYLYSSKDRYGKLPTTI